MDPWFRWLPAAGVLALTATLCLPYRSYVRAEWTKIGFHPFLYFVIGILAVAIPVWAEANLALLDFRIAGYRTLSAYLVFSLGAAFGMKLATVAVLIFASLSFAGEFDRGTIKIILTRPATRTEIFLSKVGTLLLLALALTVGVLAYALLWGLFRGEVGHIWHTETHDVFLRSEAILDHAATAASVLWTPMLATVALGIFLSNLTDSSGYAVSLALIAFVFLDPAAAFMAARHDPRVEYLFTFYPQQAFGTLTDFTRGSAAARWPDAIVSRWMHVVVPTVTFTVLILPSYLRFVRRNIVV